MQKRTYNPMSDANIAQETPLLAEVEDLTFEEVYRRLTGTLKSKGDLYLGSANAREAAHSAKSPANSRLSRGFWPVRTSSSPEAPAQVKAPSFT